MTTPLIRGKDWCLLLGLTMCLSGCISTRLLKEQEYLLVKQKIKGNEHFSQSTLAAYCQQQPNSTFLGIPFGLWLYQSGQRDFDPAAVRQRLAAIEAEFEARATAAGNERKINRLRRRRDRKIRGHTILLKEGNLLMRWGEPPVLYSLQQRVVTEKNLLAYLHSKGYFDAQVHSNVKVRNKKVIVTYHIIENTPHLIGKLQRDIPDAAIAKLLEEHQQESLLKQGDCYDQEALANERERIYQLLSNHGYFSFDRQYIQFNVDTTAVDNTVIVETAISPLAANTAHPKYTIKHVTFEVDTTAEQPAATHEGITFKNCEERLSPKALAHKISLPPGQSYSKQAEMDVQKRLSRLVMFKYVNFTYEIAEDGQLIPHIHVSPLDRFQISSELGLEVSQWLPRPVGKFSLQSKNIFGKLETLTLAAHACIEGETGLTQEQDLVSSKVIGLDASLRFPQFLLPLSTATHTAWDRYSPITKLSVGYNFKARPEYTQHIFKGLISYSWRSWGAYVLSPLQVDWLNTTNMSSEFEKVLEKLYLRGSNFYRVFKPSWISYASLQATFSTQRDLAKQHQPYSSLRLYLESGGTLQNFIDLRKIASDLEYYQYIKLDVSYSQHIPLAGRTIFAYRLRTGIAIPYGTYRILPHSRYYFAGGANDMRAWMPHRLGPGTYRPPTDQQEQQHLPEQHGELLAQSSVELRQPLWGPIEGALFVDAGNVWMLQDDYQLGGKFRWQDFHQAIAVGTGVGLRLNFQFLVIRFDVGFKVYDPTQPKGHRLLGNRLSSDRSELAVYHFNFNIGYPF